jgi:hypothetical protein
MKSLHLVLLAAVVTVTTHSAFATGLLSCVSADKKYGIEAYTSRSFANAIVEPVVLTLNGKQRIVTQVQYKNRKSELYLLTVDDIENTDPVQQREAELDVKVDRDEGTGQGTLTIREGDVVVGSPHPVTCTLE